MNLKDAQASGIELLGSPITTRKAPGNPGAFHFRQHLDMQMD